MARLRLAILKEIDVGCEVKEIKMAELPSKEFLEYDETLFCERIVMGTVRHLHKTLKKGIFNRAKTYTEEEISGAIETAFNEILNEMKQETVRVK